jgi:hypothetical protein
MNAIDGSRIAKSGYQNEIDMAREFTRWRNSIYAQRWLNHMNYNLYDITSVYAICNGYGDSDSNIGSRLHKSKTDVRLLINLRGCDTHCTENIQVKLVSNKNGLNQIDKKWVDRYVQMWNIQGNVANILKRFTGEIPPNIENPRDHRRMFMDEFSHEERNSLLEFLRDRKDMIMENIFVGTGEELDAEWMLVVQRYNRQYLTGIRSIDSVIDIFRNGDVRISAKGSVKIGKVLMQRKGGDAGRWTSNMLQFKIDPSEIVV